MAPGGLVFPAFFCLAGGKGSTWRGAFRWKHDLKQTAEGRGNSRVTEITRNEVISAIGVEVKSPTILKMDKKRGGQTGIKRLAKAY